MSHKRLARQVVLAKHTGKQPRGRPKPNWSYYMSDLAWSRLVVEPAQVREIDIDREVFQVLLGLLPSDVLKFASGFNFFSCTHSY